MLETKMEIMISQRETGRRIPFRTKPAPRPVIPLPLVVALPRAVEADGDGD